MKLLNNVFAEKSACVFLSHTFLIYNIISYFFI